MDNSKKKGLVSSFVLTGLFLIGLLSILFFNPYTIAGVISDEGKALTLIDIIIAVVQEGEGGLMVLAFAVMLVTFLSRFILFLLLGLAKCNVIKKDGFDVRMVKILKSVDAICFILDDAAILYLFFYFMIAMHPMIALPGLPIEGFYFGVSLAAYLITRKMAKQIA